MMEAALVRIALLLTVLVAGASHSDGLGAQTRPVAQVSGGLGFSLARSAEEPYGVGGGLVFEYEAVRAGWIAGRLYGGAVMSGTARHSCRGIPCTISSQIGVGGAKARLIIPIPLVSPFLELGAGLSAGAITTRYGYVPPGSTDFLGVDEDHAGLMIHIPVSVGLAFGAHRQHDISFKYFSHPDRDHVTAMFSLGIGFAWQ
jgi:hypothetical protein